jgi:hypothetical protein
LPPQQRLRPSGRAKEQARLPGRTPATQKITVIQEFGKKGAIHSPTNTSQLENLKIHFR